MSITQENNFKTAFYNINALKRSYALLTAEKNKNYPNSTYLIKHELELVQAMLQIELSIRALQREARESGYVDNNKEEDNDDNSPKM